jgi:hypothetical protein
MRATAIGVLIVLACGVAAQESAPASSGRLVDLDGCKIHLSCTGKGARDNKRAVEFKPDKIHHRVYAQSEIVLDTFVSRRVAYDDIRRKVLNWGQRTWNAQGYSCARIFHRGFVIFHRGFVC